MKKYESYYEANRAACKEFMKTASLSAEVKEEIKIINEGYYRNPQRRELELKYNAMEIKSKEQLLSLPLVKSYYDALNEENKHLVNNYLDLMPSISTSTSTYVRSYKTTHCYKDVLGFLNTIEVFLTYQFIGFDIIKYMQGEKYFDGYYNDVRNEYVSAYLSGDNASALINEIKKMLYDTEGIKNVSYSLIRGMLQSTSEEAKDIVMDLLKSAKLSEGLRQSIVENIDLGSIDTYIKFLEYIKNENLIRFSSVKRSFLTFTGLEYELGDKGIDNLGNYIIEALIDKKPNEYLESENALKFYIGLYALACYEFSKATDYVFANFDQLPSYKKGVALYFLAKSEMNFAAYLVTNTLNADDNHNNHVLILDNLPEYLFFNDDNDKREYVKAYIKAVSRFKANERYSVFINDVNQSASSYSMSNSYNTVLKLVDELDDLYEEAYSVFEKRYYKYSDGFNITEIKHPIVREILIKGVGSNLEDMRSFAVDKIKELKLQLTEDEYITIAGFMKSKRSDTRKYVSRIIADATEDIILKACENLLNDKNKNCQAGAISIMVDNLDRISNHKEFAKLKKQVNSMKFDESIADSVDIVLGKQKEVRKLFFDNNKLFNVPQISYNRQLVDKFMNYNANHIHKLVDEFYDIFMSHKGEEVEFSYYDGSKYKEKVGFNVNFVRERSYRDQSENKKYESYIFYEDFIKYADTISPEDLVIFNYITFILTEYNSAFGKSWDNDDKKLDYFIENKYIPDHREIFARYRDADKDDKNTQRNKIHNFAAVVRMLIEYYKEEKSINVFDGSNEMFANLAAYILEKELNRLQSGNMPSNDDDDDESTDNKEFIPNSFFSEFNIITRISLELCDTYFDNSYIYMILQNLFELYKSKGYPWDDNVEFHLVEKGVMPLEQLYQLVFDTTELKDTYSTYSHSRSILSGISNSYKYKRKLSDLKKEVYKKAIAYMLEVELDRTEKDTEYSDVISHCHHFFGTETFIKAVSKMGKMPFVRGYSWGEEGKKESFSNIVANVVPDDDISQEEFNALVKKYKIDKIRLLEAAMYNLNFITYVENYLKIKGLTKAAYFFKAHMNESLNDEEKKIIRRYSDLGFAEFENGQMDINWFKESYAELGKKNFALVYDAAKYITDGGKHKRAQYFTDAVLGKLKIKEVESRINDKRNQEMILAYGLLPLKGNKDNAALKRYKRLQLFLKQSKEYGAQRQQSEALKVSIAMNNLARNYGISADQFTWMMEAKLIDKLQAFFTPKKVADITVHLDLNKVENPDIIVIKNDKQLKSVPAKLNKNAYIKELKNVKKQLKDQYKRARNTLEQAMINSDEYAYEQLLEINNHPVIQGILKDLLFYSDGKVGFFRDDKLISLTESYPLFEKDSILRIAHPADLLENNWVEWQNHIMQHSIKQPFKQVFRELYTMTKEEQENDGYTNRFAGYQIEGRRMLGIMKSRGWMINDYDGFEKINHKSNLRIDLYSYADWFTPNDIEQPTIEKVVFIDNKTNKSMNMKELSPILFSETMRDIDLVVSVAYVGGVDPVYQHTTIEMRRRILEHNLSLFKVDNYSIDKNHVVVNGKLGNYSIHLGSGIIHMENKGMLPVFPVHSQQRGHIFLPFVDQDPKTAEIISKVLMLAKDNEIKDPSVLIHLR